MLDCIHLQLDVKVFVPCCSTLALHQRGGKKLKNYQGLKCEELGMHILHANLQASVWLQDSVTICTDPVTLRWQQLEDGHYVPVVSKGPACTTEAVVELVNCPCVQWMVLL